MTSLMINNNNFDPTWGKIVSFLNCGKRGEDLSSYYCPKEFKLYGAAQKAVYVFICKLCDKGFFKVGLNTQINALDAEESAENDTGFDHYRPEIDQKIRQFLKKLETAPKPISHCASCQCHPFSAIPTEAQREIVEKEITALYQLAQTFMKQDIGSCMIVGAKLLRCCL